MLHVKQEGSKPCFLALVRATGLFQVDQNQPLHHPRRLHGSVLVGPGQLLFDVPGGVCVLLTFLSKAKGGRWAQGPRLSLPSLPLEPQVLLSQPSTGLGRHCLDGSLRVWLPVASAERAEGCLVLLGVQCWSPPGPCPLRSFLSPGPVTYEVPKN